MDGGHGVRAAQIDELPEIAVAGVRWRPVRRTLGITGFGINAYTADADEQLIEEHDELGPGAGHHEELYVVVRGRARFTIDGRELDAGAGALVFVPEASSRRAAIAAEDGTTALVLGGAPGTVTPSPWEYYFAAAPSADAGDPGRAYEIAAAALTDHPDNPSLHYNLACFAAQAGETDRALDHLRRAFEGDPRTREWAASETDLDAIRSDPRYPG